MDDQGTVRINCGHCRRLVWVRPGGRYCSILCANRRTAKDRANSIASIEEQGMWAGACHLWTRYIDGLGYGRVRYKGKLWYIQKLLWKMRGGEDGVKLKNTCGNKTCMTPGHWVISS